MEQRISFVTLRVADLDAAVAHHEAMGWTARMVVPGAVAFFELGPGIVLSLFHAEGFDADLGGAADTTFTLAHNLNSAEEVDAVVAEMVATGATVAKAPQRADWGGYHATVIDPLGVAWEIAHNPGVRIEPDGSVTWLDP